jgi:hypothetical protein
MNATQSIDSRMAVTLSKKLSAQQQPIDVIEFEWLEPTGLLAA